MKSNTKKWLGCALTLLLALPAFASKAAQQQLEQQVLTLLKQGKGTQVKTLLENIPQCPEDNAQLYQKEIPVRCTHRKFNSAAPDLREYGDDVAVLIKSVLDPGFTKPATIAAVRPANAFVTAMSQYYTHLYRVDIKTYNQASYVKFSNHFQDPWLREMARSVLALKLWDRMEIEHYGINWKDGTDDSKEAGKLLYQELEWRMKLGMNFQQALQAESKIASSVTIRKEYLWNVGHFSPDVRLIEIFSPWEGRSLYDGFREEAVKNNNVALFYKYKQYIYYSFFTTNDFESSMGELYHYHTLLLQFGSKSDWSSDGTDFERLWNFVATPMPKNLKEQMRKNIGKHIKFICTHPDALKEVMNLHYGKGTREIQEGLAWCENFKKQAIKHDLWPMSEAEKQALQRKIQSQVQREVGVQKQQQQKRNKMQIDMLDALQKSF